MKDERWLDFMRRAWTPVLVEDGGAPAAGSIDVPDLPARIGAAGPDPRVVQTEYGIDHVLYRISTDRPLLLVENEIDFPGWTAKIGGAIVPAVRVNDLFRGWRLPAGTYDLETAFRLSGIRALAAVTGASWLAWLLVLIQARRRDRPAR